MAKLKQNIGPILILLVAILAGIVTFSYLVNPMKTNMVSKTETMTTEEIQNVGQNAIITETVITQRLTGSGPFDSDDTAGNDSSQDNNIVRSFDQITWTIENTMALKNNTLTTGLKGGRIKLTAELPASTANLVKWDLDSMGWAEDATVSEDGRTFTGYYTMDETKVTVPGKQNLVAVLKIYGAPNGMEIKPTFKTSLVGNSDGEVKTITDNATKVSAAPNYNVELQRNTYFNTEIDLEENGKTTRGRMYGYSIGLQLYNENSSKGLKGIEYPQGDIAFDIDLKMERVDNGSSDTTDITSGATPILYNYALNESTNSEGQIANRPMEVAGVNSVYNPYYPINNGHHASSVMYGAESVYNSGTIHMEQQGSKLHVTVKNYDFNGEFPKNRYYQTAIPSNVGYFGTYYFQVLVPYTDATLIDDSTYYLTASDENFSATSVSNTRTSTQVIISDDTERATFVRYIPGYYGNVNWLRTSINPSLHLTSYYTEGDARAGIGRIFAAAVGVRTNPGNVTADDIYDASSLLKFDGNVFEISESRGKVWEVWTVKVGDPQNVSTMDFQMLYAAKPDGSNWVSDIEMGDAEEEDLVYFTSLEALKSSLGQNAKCVGVLWESISGVMKANEEYGLSVALKVTDNAQVGMVYQFVSAHSLYKQAKKLDRTTQTRSNANASFPTPDVRINFGKDYIKTAYDEDGNIVTGTHSGSFNYGQSLLIVNGTAKVTQTVADLSDGKAKVNYDLGKDETVVTYDIKPIIAMPEGNTDVITGITVTLTDTLPKGLTYVSGSSSREYGEPTVTANADGTTTLVWTKRSCTTGEEMPTLTFKAAIDLTSANGTSYTNTVVIDTDKLTPYTEESRTASTTINVIRLASYSLVKSTETPLIEKNAEGSYTLAMLNMTDSAVNDFQLLDILPYNGDSYGTSFNGTYTVSKIELSASVNGDPISVADLKLSITDSESVRSGVTAKDSGLGTSSIWTRVASGDAINREVKGIAIVGKLPAKARLQAKIYIKTSGNDVFDKYVNGGSAQTNTATEAISSPVATIQVMKRTLEGKVWFDSNKDGLMNEGEEFLANAKVTLLNEDGTIAKGSDGTYYAPILTGNDGSYKFEYIPKGNYKVMVEYYTEDDTREITLKNVGDNDAINNKFNSNATTDLITELNSTEELDLVKSNVNAGITYKNTSVVVHHYIMDENGNRTTNKVPAANGTPVADETINGKIKDKYTTNARTDLGDKYELAETPANSTGKMTKDQIEVTYYYSKTPANLVVKYVDEEGNELLPAKETDGYVGDAYRTEPEEIEKYECYEVTGSPEQGNLAKGGTEVIYHYRKAPTQVIVHHYIIDEEGNKTTEPVLLDDGSVAQDEVIDGRIDDTYTTNAKENLSDKYQLEETEIPANKEGIMTKDPIEVTYYYSRTPAKVVVKYVDEEGKELIPQTQEDGFVGNEYKTEPKEIENYEFVEATGAAEEGEFTKEDLEVIYHYKRIPSTVVVEYLDKDTEEPVAEEETLDGFVGDDYSSEEKEVKYYELVEAPENKEGTYTKEEQTVTYYYKKLPFNIAVEKTVKELTVNGESKSVGTDGKLTKLEIPESKLATASVIVKYKVVVKNTEKVDGKAQIIENIPAGFEVAEGTPDYWQAIEGEKLALEVELKAGEAKELEIVLKWKNSSQNLGTIKNIVEVASTNNVPGYADNNTDDNMAVAEVVISVKTGIEVMSDILIISGTIGLTLLLAVAVVDIKRHK